MITLKYFFLYPVNKKFKKIIWLTFLVLLFGSLGVVLNQLVMRANDGLMQVSSDSPPHTILILEEGAHEEMTSDSNLPFLADRILTDSRWLDSSNTPDVIRWFADITNFGPAGMYMVSIGDLIILFSTASTLILLPSLIISILYLSLKSLLSLL